MQNKTLIFVQYKNQPIYNDKYIKAKVKTFYGVINSFFRQ